MRLVLALFWVTLSSAVGSAADLATDDGRLKFVRDFSVPRGDFVPRPDGVYSEWHVGPGDRHSLSLIDPDTGGIELMAPDVPYDSRLLAQDSRYVLYSVSGIRLRLYLRDRATGAVTRSIRLQDPVAWTRIVGDRAEVLQSGSLLVFSLPDMKLVSKAPSFLIERAFRSEGIKPWRNRLVILDRELRIADSSLGVLETYPVPTPAGGRSCLYNTLQVVGDDAYFPVACGIIRAIDLVTGKTKFELNVGGIELHFAVLRGVLFVTDPVNADTLQLFDATTGQDLGRVSSPSGQLVSGNRNLTVIRRPESYSAPTRLTVLEPDIDAIRDPQARRNRFLAGCPPRALDQAVNLYVLIDACESAGLESVLAATPAAALEPEIKKAVTAHALRLISTLSRYRSGARLLEELGVSHLHPGAIRTAQRKNVELAQGGVEAPTPEPSRGASPVEFNEPSLSEIHFLDNYIIATSWPCRGSAFSMIPVTIYDRGSFKRLGSVDVVPCDAEEDVSLAAVDLVSDHLVVRIDPQFSESRPNVGIIRLADMSLVGTVQVDGGIGAFVTANGRVVNCRHGKRLDLETAREVPIGEVPDPVCSPGSGFVELGKDPDYSVNPVPALTYDLVQGTRMVGTEFLSVARPRSGDGPDIELALPGNPRDWLIAVDSDTLYIWRPRDRFSRLVEVSLPSQAERVLLEVEDPARWGPTVRWREFLFVAHGRHLMTIATPRGDVIGYDRNIVTVESRKRCETCREDMNDVDALSVDGDRLVVRTRSGEANVVVDLPVYVRSLRSGDPFGERTVN